MPNVDRVQNNLQRQYWTMPLSLNRSSLNKETKTDGKLTGIAALCTFRCFIFCRSDDDIAVSAAAAAVTHINILNCHSCLV